MPNDLVFDFTKQALDLPPALTLEEIERQIIQTTLNEMEGNRRRTAEKLGVSLRWLQYRLKDWNNEQ
jgi:DNA-binding NtrC family response regulator